MDDYFCDQSQCAQHEIFPGVRIFTMHGEHLMLSLVELQPQAVVAEHSHPHEQLGIMLEGELTFTIGGQTRLLRAGQMWRIPGGVLHSAVAGPAGARAVDMFYPIRADYT